MLKIQTLFRSKPARQIVQAFAPVVDDGDELLHEIATQPEAQDNAWRLDEAPDSSLLSDYWHSVEDDTI